MTAAFSLRCLGGPTLFAASGEPVRFRTRKHLALLVRMALEPGRMFTRDYLTDLLWHTAQPKLANHSLAQGLSVIKAKVAREAVLIQRAMVGLAPGWVDVDAQHLSNGDAEIAGPFLDGFDIQAARPFEDWKEEYRAHLLPQLRDCLVRQMDAARRLGDFATVERRAERLHALDPLAEEAVRGIMEARAWAGDRTNALKVFARYETQLAEELDAKPSADLCRVADLLRDGRRLAPRAGSSEPVTERVERRFEPETLIGREREFSFLYDAWLDARRKRPRIVVVTSDPGVGKTTLANAFVSSCQMDGAVVARAQAYDAERELPFAVLGELVRQLASQRAIGSADPEALSELTRISAEILRVFPGVPKPVEWSPELTPLRIADAFLKTVTAAAEESPVVLVVDDIHAADNASTAILHVVARKLVDVRVLMILAGRTSELRLSGAPAAFTADSSIHRISALDMDVLSQDAAERLVLQLVTKPHQTKPPTERLLRASGGNPLALELLTKEWDEHGSASLLHCLEALNTHPAPSIGIPRAIGTVFERQSARLDGLIRSALDLAAVLGRRLDNFALYSAVDLSVGQAAAAMSRLMEEGFLREVRGELEFRNELIRAEAYYAIPGSLRQHLHRRIADHLRAQSQHWDGTALLEVAWHYLRGADARSAVPFAIAGAEASLAVGAPHAAEEALSAVVDFDLVPSDQKKIRLLLAKALLEQSNAGPVLPIIDALAKTSELNVREHAEVAMMRAAAEFALNTEPGMTYCETAKVALACAEKTGDPDLVSRALFECARAGAEEGLIELIQIADDGIRQLAARHDVNAFPMAVLTSSFCKMFSLDMAGGRDFLKSVVQRGPHGNPAQMSYVHSGIGLASLFLCEFDEAFIAYSRALELSKRMGDDARTSLLYSNLCTLQVSRGAYRDAVEYGKLAISLGEACSSSLLQIAYTNVMDAYVLMGQEDNALECMSRARNWLVPRRRWKLHCGFLAESATFALIRGNTALALDLVAQLETITPGREDAVPMIGPYWKLRIFRAAHVFGEEAAFLIAHDATRRFKGTCPYHYLDVLGARAWLETRAFGKPTPETQGELVIFDDVGAYGRRALLAAQGFLKAIPSPAQENGASADRHEPVPGSQK